jgi:hypothetical protein
MLGRTTLYYLALFLISNGIENGTGVEPYQWALCLPNSVLNPHIKVRFPIYTYCNGGRRIPLSLL